MVATTRGRTAIAPPSAAADAIVPRTALARLGLGLAMWLLAAASAWATVGITLATGNATPVAGGAAFSYTVTLTNNDLISPATNVVMTFPMPPSIAFLNFALVETSPVAPPAGTRGFFSCTAPAVGENGMVVCRASSFPASSAMVTTTATITIVAQVDAGVASGVRTATARVAAGGVQFTDSEQQNIQVSAPLSITVEGPANAVRGSNIVYAISVNNGGSSTALNATINDNLPATTSFVSMTGTGPFHDGCQVNPATNSVSCNSVDIPSGLSRLTLVVKTSSATPLGNLSNTATITNGGTGSIAVGASVTNTTIAP